ncbi:MAG: lysophospholipid acyltransferase family protein [Gemmatimonadetes bacterium]|nr:lysophospholipid acyltransferase family protein [Gemmatimonadota bacterium]
MTIGDDRLSMIDDRSSPTQPTDVPLGCPRRGSARSQAVARRILGIFGWRMAGSLPDAPRFVLIVAPHTSNWDFPLGILAMFAVGLQLTWLGKHTLFRFPVRGLLRWLGGEPVDRSAPHGVVGAAIERFRDRPQWVLAISPEGTRRRIPQWKSGYHRVAHGAGVPILPVAIDYRRRVIEIGTLFQPTDDASADTAALRSRFTAEMARYPALFATES